MNDDLHPGTGNMTILLVEDNPDDVFLTLRALKKHRVANDIVVVGDGAEALDYLFCQNQYAERPPSDLPQLVLLDLHLPKMDGLDVLRHIRADERTRPLPVVILTASKDDQKRLESLASGSDAFMRKPVDFDQLIATVPQLGISWVLVNEEPDQ